MRLSAARWALAGGLVMAIAEPLIGFTIMPLFSGLGPFVLLLPVVFGGHALANLSSAVAEYRGTK
jgi:hypothetical protein